MSAAIITEFDNGRPAAHTQRRKNYASAPDQTVRNIFESYIIFYSETSNYKK